MNASEFASYTNHFGNTAVLNVTDIEAELPYGDLSATFTMIDYEVVNWGYRADWKDGQVTNSTHDSTPSHINDKGYRLRDRAPAQVWFSHSYQTPNSNPGYPVDLIDSGQIAGRIYPDGQFTHIFPQTLRVWRRVPVAEVSVLPQRAKPGNQVTLKISLDGAAPPCGTIVLFDFPRDLFVPLPSHFVVPPAQQTIEPTLVLLESAQLGEYKLKAWTAETQRSSPPNAMLIVV